MKAKCLALMITAGLIATSAHAEYDITLTQDDIVSVYDGDTFKINIPTLPAIFGEELSVRVNGIDTPELRGAQCPEEKALGLQAKEVTETMVLNAEEIKLTNLQRGKYFRLVADVYVDGVNLTEVLVEKGLGYRYDGGTKESWCE